MLDELTYASREDRNLTIMGGGEIAWDGTTATFDDDIYIYDHITDKETAVDNPTAGSTALTVGQVAYILKVRKPGSNQLIQVMNVASAGALPNTTSDATSQVIVMFHHTKDGTLYIPHAKKELIAGDHWQFGASLTWFERKASSHKPNYHAATTGVTVTVPGSTDSPAVVFIDGKIYANTSDETCVLSGSGRSGLDTGTIAANTPYYLYAIPATSGRGFDVVASAADPTTGPTGFGSWSYIGSCATYYSAATIYRFQSTGGKLVTVGISTDNETGGTSGYVSHTISNMPLTVKIAYMRMVGDCGTGGSKTDDIYLSGDNVNYHLRLRWIDSGTTLYTKGWVPIYTPQTVYISADSANFDPYVGLCGWQENPMEYK